MRLLAALCFTLVASLAAAQGVPDTTPEALVRHIYQQYVGKKGTDDFNFDWSAKPLVDQLFEPALARAIEEAGRSDEPIIDYDPFVNAQDFEIKSYDLKTEQQTANSARLAASFTNFDEKVVVRYDLVMVNGRWRIRDISSGEESLRKTLKMP